ncbi:NUDIX hydrolase [Treponema putidum]|uniref:GDP-mannose pyrophosphatase n=1 Tax=Treponema putidum TaxID=221027 RepID=A0AAE9MW56_9SPIR|nr:NUDIX hydrolase [Treponema putidum]AIN93611.1 DNA mismatch repair protein MutT [Treponema putidum]TWI75492.1 NUDIX domain-containing protein [Treponema putidum]UTY29857.1 NUDIX hydrolase [Treponema putidum]UTY32309.1 NUDIX hydrolase [Treponema putidum]UTY34715.1 NUDIX hydrolase [Treponema putidum]
MEKNDKIIWKPDSSREVLKTRVFTVCEKDSISPEGEKKTFISLKAPSWVIIVPVYRNSSGEDMFVMVQQWRHGAENVYIEFPGGVVDKGEKAEDAALRELLEETGRAPKKIKCLSVLSPNPAIMENTCTVFFAELDGTEGKQNLDDDEFLNILEIPVKKVIQNMGNPPYTHAMMNAALFLYLKEKEYH